jgi:type I restriction enzyme S subunit
LKREKEYLIHSCITILRANLEIIDPVILGYKIKSIESQIEAMGSGTTGQTSLNNSLLGELKLIIPSKNIQDKLSPILKSISLKIDSNYIEIETLSALRDVLLPKLMKGELRVRDFND